MKKATFVLSSGLLSTAALTLVACGKSNAIQNDSKSVARFSSTVPAKTAVAGGTVKVGIATDTPFTGVFNDELYTSVTDAEAMQYGAESLLATDDLFKFTDKGAATVKLDRQAKTVTINIKKGVKWSDGKPVTAKDYEYAYEIIANPATKSQRYSSSLTDLKGLAAYHAGKAKTISGLEMPNGENGNKIVLHMQEMKPGMDQSGNGYFWETAAPYHYLKDVAFKDLMSSNKIRKNPLFFGPYKLTKVVRGQSVTWTPNKFYYRGVPKIAKIEATVISPNSVAQSIKSNKFDVMSVLNSQWQQVKGTKNVNFIATIPLQYSYLGIKMGKWDAKKGENVVNPHAKMGNKALRQAIAYGMNVDQVYKRYSSGLSFRVPTLIPAQFGDFFDKSVKGYTYDIKKGNEILDKAGFKKKGTYRVQPNGKPLTIRLAAMSGSATQEPIVQNYIQQWKKLGLHVVLTSGRLIEFNSFYDKVQNDDSQVDMFMGVWQLSSEPSQNDMYGRKAPMNYTRFASAENDKLLDEMGSKQAFNHSYRVQKFHEWQKYMFDQAYVVPIANSYQIVSVNKNLTGYSLRPSLGNGQGFPNWYRVALNK